MNTHLLSTSKLLVSLLLCILASSTNVLGQGNFGSITGGVYDATGAVIPGVRITAIGLETGLQLSTETTTVGSYLIPNLPNGEYRVTITSTGFKTFTRQPVIVSTGTVTTVDATLEIGDVTETVTVEAASVQLETTTSGVGSVMNEDVFRKVPYDLHGMNVQSGIRQPQQFIVLVPGVTGDSSNHTINGGQLNSSTLQVDGHNWQLINRPGIMNSWPPPFEANEEFKLNTAQYGAENPIGTAVTQFTFKSGTDDFHGSFTHLSRNDAFNARGFFGREPSPTKINESTITVGGPIVKGKTHFFGLVTRYSRRGKANAARRITVPTPLMKQGDFSEYVFPDGRLRQIFDPSTTMDNGSGGFTREPFPDNVIPQDRIGPVGRNGAALMVDPSLPGIINNHVIVGGAGENVWLPNIKIDHSWTPNQITRGSYFGTRRDRVRPSGYEGPLGPGDASDFNNNNYMVSHSSVWSSSLVTEFRFAIAPWIGPQINVGITDVAGTDALGISGIPSIPGITPRLNISSIFGPLGNANRQIFRSTRKHHTFGNTTNWTKGRNQFKFGFTGVLSHDNTSRGLNVVGTFAFNNRSTSDPDAPNVGQLGHGLASFLLGDVYQSSRLIWRPDVQERQRMRRVEVFFQDDLKVTNKLTLNLGISYHIPYPYIDAEDNVSAVYLDVPNPGADGLPGALVFAGEGPGRIGRKQLVDTYYKSWAPRFGFAYRWNEKTVFRGGIGVYYGFAPSHTVLNGTPREGMIFTDVLTSEDQGVTHPFNINDGVPPANITLPSVDPTLKNGGTADYVHPRSGVPPFSTNWSFGIQRELPKGLFLDVSYVANKSSRLPSQLENIQQLHPSILDDPVLAPILNRNINDPLAVAAGVEKPFSSFRGTVGRAIRPFPQYQNLRNRHQGNGFSQYHSLQIKFDKRAGDFFFLNAYTLSKLIDTGGDNRGRGNPVALDTNRRFLEKALSFNDQTHTFVTSAVYELPFGPGKKWLNTTAGNIFGNWRLSWSMRYFSGRPIGLTSGQSLPIFGGTNRPNRVEGVPLQAFSGDFDPSVHRYINPDAFEDPGLNALGVPTFGTLGRTLSNLREPFFLNENFILTKLFKPKENHTAEVYVTMLNAFNRVRFGAPTTNVSSARFGTINRQVNEARQLEIGLRYLW